MSGGGGELGLGSDLRLNHRNIADGTGQQKLSLGGEKPVQRTDNDRAIRWLETVALDSAANEVTVTTAIGKIITSSISGSKQDLFPGFESPDVDPVDAEEARDVAERATETRTWLVGQLCGQAA